MAFMVLTKDDPAYHDYQEVLLNPAFVTQVQTITYAASEDRPSRTLLSIRVQGGDGLKVLALDENSKPIVPADAAQRSPGELLRLFNQAVRRAS